MSIKATQYLNTRHFSNGHYRKMTGNVSEELLEYQKKFEVDPHSIDNAFYYFRVRVLNLIITFIGVKQKWEVPDSQSSLL